MDEKKWISPHLLAGYGVLTWTMYHAMEKVSTAFGDVGLFGVIRVGGVTGAWGHIAASSLFVPCVCIISAVPLIIHVCSYIPRKMLIRETQFRSEPFELQTDSAQQLVDTGRKNELPSDSVVPTPQDQPFEVRGRNRVREDRMGEMDNVVSLHDEAAKRGAVRDRRPKRRK